MKAKITIISIITILVLALGATTTLGYFTKGYTDWSFGKTVEVPTPEPAPSPNPNPEPTPEPKPEPKPAFTVYAPENKVIADANGKSYAHTFTEYYASNNLIDTTMSGVAKGDTFTFKITFSHTGYNFDSWSASNFGIKGNMSGLGTTVEIDKPNRTFILNLTFLQDFSAPIHMYELKLGINEDCKLNIKILGEGLAPKDTFTVSEIKIAEDGKLGIGNSVGDADGTVVSKKIDKYGSGENGSILAFAVQKMQVGDTFTINLELAPDYWDGGMSSWHESMRVDNYPYSHNDIIRVEHTVDAVNNTISVKLTMMQDLPNFFTDDYALCFSSGTTSGNFADITIFFIGA